MTRFIKSHSKQGAEDHSLIKYAPWVRENLKHCLAEIWSEGSQIPDLSA